MCSSSLPEVSYVKVEQFGVEPLSSIRNRYITTTHVVFCYDFKLKSDSSSCWLTVVTADQELSFITPHLCV